jgi:hypothetical protein
MVAAFSTMDLLQEPKTLRPEDALHQHAVGGGPSIELHANDDIIGVALDDIFPFDLVFRNSVL